MAGRGRSAERGHEPRDGRSRIGSSDPQTWATFTIENPGAPISRYISVDMQSSARELVRRGLTDLAFASTRSAQSLVWHLWMELAFTLTQGPQELREFLSVSSRSIAACVDSNMEGMAEFLRLEREAFARGTHADRRELVTRIVEGTARRLVLRKPAGVWVTRSINLSTPPSSGARRQTPTRDFSNKQPRRWRDVRPRATSWPSSRTQPRCGSGCTVASRLTWSSCGG